MRIHYNVHPLVWVVIVFVLAVQLMAIGKVRGVGDGEGYLLNTSRIFSLNTYEDDGSANLALALGQGKNLPRYLPYGIDIGGPYIYLGRFVLLVAERLGLVTLFSDPSLYLLYPDAYRTVWKTFAVYKAVLLMLVPLVLYWLCTNFFTKLSGIFAVLIFAAMPFVPGFEVRLKVDVLAVAVGLLSVMHQIQFLRTRQPRYCIFAAAWLGLSLSMKLILITTGLTLICFLVYCSIKCAQRLRYFLRVGTQAAIVFLTVYVLANPMVIPGWYVYFTSIAKHLGENSNSSIGTLHALWLRWSSFDIFFGPVFLWLIPPVLVFSIYLTCRFKENRAFFGTLLSLLILQTIYFSLSFRGALANTTYYYYSHAILLIPLMASCFAWLRIRVLKMIPSIAFVVIPLFCAALFFSFKSQVAVLQYLTSRTDRQNFLHWIDNNLVPGASIGVPVERFSNVIDSLIRVDPFRYRVVPVGKDASLAAQYLPDYILWVRPSPVAKALALPEYDLAACFNAGSELPHNRYDLYQEEVFELYARKSSLPQKSPSFSPWNLEYDIGRFLRRDMEQQFNIMQFQGMHFYPISLDLFRKTQQTIVPFPTQAFAGAVRYRTSPLTYVHQADPLCLPLWGVKYVVADMRPESAFLTHTLGRSGKRFEFMQQFEATFEGQPRKIGIFKNIDYLGQVFFAPESLPRERNTLQRTHGRFLERPLKTYGTLYPQEFLLAGNVTAIEVRLVIETDTTVDVLIKSSGHTQSYLIGPGYHDVLLPYTVANSDGSIDYEINTTADSGNIIVHALSASPLRLQKLPNVDSCAIDSRQAFVHFTNFDSGRVFFALPFHKYWVAEVDGQRVQVTPGPAGCVAIPVMAGEHFIALRTTFLR